MKKSKFQTVPFFFVFALCFTNFAYNQTTLFTVLDSSQVSLTTSEQSNLTKIQQDNSVEAHWLISVNSLENILNGRALQVTFPDEGSSTTFQADFPFSEQAGSYYWIGYNLDGSIFRIAKTTEGFWGNAYIAATDKYYGFTGLSSSRTAMVRYKVTTIQRYESCGTSTEEEDTTNTEVGDRGGCETNLIRVLFLYTPAVATSVPSPYLVSLGVIGEINAACGASGIGATDVHFGWAGTVLLPGFIEHTKISDDLDAVCNNSTAQGFRDSYYADIVVLLTASGHTDAIGIAPLKASNGRAYAVAELAAANVGFTATHEIGHILGARHQRCTACNVTGCDDKKQGHGFLVGTTMRTILAQNTCPTNPTRIGRWSSSTTPFMGLATGDSDNNNGAQILSRADKVCCFRSNPPFGGGGSSGSGGSPFLVSINGAREICNTQGYYPYQAVVTATPAVVYPLSYVWEISPIGVGNWTVVSTSNSYVITNPANLPNYWITIRLTVTDAANNTSVGFLEVKRIDCFGGSGSDGGGGSSLAADQTPSTAPIVQVTITPNPALESLTIKGVENESQINIFDMNGRLLQIIAPNYGGGNEINVDLSGMYPGLYVISIKKPGPYSPIKMRFVKL